MPKNMPKYALDSFIKLLYDYGGRGSTSLSHYSFNRALATGPTESFKRAGTAARSGVKVTGISILDAGCDRQRTRRYLSPGSFFFAAELVNFVYPVDKS
jgi:hypothetical protein